ncbi:MAG: hypothetical protein ACLP2Y_00140 [Limisphaerales bacterium]
MKTVKIGASLALLALAVILSSCATPSRAFHNTDNTALVIQSWDNQTCQMLQPTTSAKEGNDQILAQAAPLPQHQTAVVILENYTEEEIGDQFRDRGTPWIVGLRNLGYQHIVFLKGLDVANPEGLITLVQYD